MSVLSSDYIKSFKFINGCQHPDFMELLIAEPGNRTMCEIIGNSDINTTKQKGKLYLGRGEDSINNEFISFDLAVGGTIHKLHESFKNVETIKLKKLSEDVDHNSFLNNNQKDLHNILQQIHTTLKKNGNVFVYCQQGKDRSAAIVIAYMMSVYNVTAQEALNYVLDKRCIVSVNDVPELWTFLNKQFIQPVLD